MPRYALYARYSSDRQSEHSIDDQVRLCREHLKRNGLEPLQIYTDYAISGAHLQSRPGAMAMMNDATKGLFDIVLAEDLSRLSRDQEDIAGIYKKLQYVNVAIETVSEGRVTELHIGLKGTMNAIFLKDLADKIRRGQKGRLAAGLCPAGLSYGYDVVKQYDAKGEPIRGLRAINPDHAAIVRRIYNEYQTGKSSQAIAAGLNRDGIPSPHGGLWGPSSISGHAGRAQGILYNEAYVGFLIYNRTRMVKNPVTGKRVNRPNPPSEWQVIERPDLRIIEPDVWDRVQAIKKSYSAMQGPRARRPKRLLSGLLKCGQCGESYVIKQKDRYACSCHTHKGACSNNTTVLAKDIEARALKALRNELEVPEAVEEFMSAYNERMAELRRQQTQSRAKLDRELQSVDRSIANMLQAIKAGMYTPAMNDEMARLERRKKDIVEEQGKAPDRQVIELHPAAASMYRKKLLDLDQLLKDPDEMTSAQNVLSALIDKILIFPRDANSKVPVEIHGALSGFLEFAATEKLPTGKVLTQITAMVVAEECFQHYSKGFIIRIAA